MQPPLANWATLHRGYRFLQKTSYSAHHLGLDLTCPTGTPILAPEAGTVVFTGVLPQGGLTMHYRLNSGPLVRFLHLHQVKQTGGQASEGEVLALTGGDPHDQPNAGPLSTGAHLHCDLSRNGRLELNNIDNFIDPESFFTENSMEQITETIFKQPAASDSVRTLIVTVGKDAGKVGILSRDGTIRVAQNDKGKFQALLAAVSHGVTSDQWSKFKEGAPLQ